MKLSLNDVTYGNPTNRHKTELGKQCLVDDLFEDLKKQPFPLNDSDATKQELNEIKEMLEDITLSDNEKYLNRYKFYDKNLLQAIVNSFQTDKVNIKELALDIESDINGLILKLKYFYQRPRPYQLANYYKLKLFPIQSTSALTPAYPSGHTIQSYVILTVIGNLCPEFYQRTKKMIDDVAYSRVYLGVHYPTDNDFGYYVAQEILKHPKFAEKYGI